MNSMKLKLLEELLSHLSESQGKDLKSLLDESKAPVAMEGAEPEIEPVGGVEFVKASVMKPKGEEVMNMGGGNKDQCEMGAEGSEEEVSDEDLKALVAKYLK